jgi:hypothetical protein
LDEYVDYIFRAEDQDKKETSLKLAASSESLFLLISPENGGEFL